MVWQGSAGDRRPYADQRLALSRGAVKSSAPPAPVMPVRRPRRASKRRISDGPYNLSAATLNFARILYENAESSDSSHNRSRTMSAGSRTNVLITMSR